MLIVVVGTREAIAMAADDALIQAMRESCGRLCTRNLL